MSRYAMCPVCGHRMRRNRDMFGNWDGETYVCDYCSGDEYDDDDEDEGENWSVHDAALAWLSNGFDDDETDYGYTAEEMRDALR